MNSNANDQHSGNGRTRLLDSPPFSGNSKPYGLHSILGQLCFKVQDLECAIADACEGSASVTSRNRKHDSGRSSALRVSWRRDATWTQ